MALPTLLINKFTDRIQLLSMQCQTFLTYLFATVYGVELGRKNLFFRFSKMQLFKNSSIKTGDHCQFRSGQASNLIGVNHKCIISTHREGARITIGDNCGFSGTSIGCAVSIEIGNGVMVGANSIITDFDWHSMDPYHRNDGEVRARPVRIGDRVWIGANCIILKGVSIGENTVVGAGSIVSSSLPANMVCAGNPCKPLRPLSSREFPGIS